MPKKIRSELRKLKNNIQVDNIKNVNQLKLYMSQTR